jgi:rhodanese-related sulfurtransferase
MNDSSPQPIRIPVKEAHERYDQGNVTVLDVLDPEDFEQLSYRIKDALRIDPREISDEYEQLPQNKTVLTY